MSAEGADAALVAAIGAFADGDFARAAAIAHGAERHFPEPLTAAAARYLARVRDHGKASAYVTGDGFAAFIRAGGNVALYEATSRAIAGVCVRAGLRVLDVGTGDGRALLPALAGSDIAHLTAIEPSPGLRAALEAELAAREIPHAVFAGALDEFIAAHPDARFDVAVATFSLQSIAPAQRMAQLRWMADHCDTLALAEFDAPDLTPPLRPQTIATILGRYRNGLAEYAADPEPTVQGFLMPVLFGYFDPTAARTNFEQPVAAWQAELAAVGFAYVDVQRLCPYWWAEAQWVVARRGG